MGSNGAESEEGRTGQGEMIVVVMVLVSVL